MAESQNSSSTQTSEKTSRSSVGPANAGVSGLRGNKTAIRATGRFLKQELWAWPILAAVVFGGAGLWVHHAVESAMRHQRADDLNAKVDACVNAVRVWIEEQRINAQVFVEDENLAPLITELQALADGTPTAPRNLLESTAQEQLRARLMPKLRIAGYTGFQVVSPAGVVLAADHDAILGISTQDYLADIFQKAISGQTLISKPFRSSLLLPDENGVLHVNLPRMFVAGPIRNVAGDPIAAIGLRIRPEDRFTRVFRVVRFGDTGESYAFDRTGLLLSGSRFDDDLKQVGLLVDQPDSNSTLTVDVRDPQVDMTTGARPTIRRPDQPLTRMALAATQGQDGVDADGYRDYMGRTVVGAWRWLEDYDFGVATEANVSEEFEPVFILRRAFWGLMSLLLLSAIGIFVAMLFITRQQRALQHATLAAKQLGQYSLEEKLGSGGMGTVYKARHALLRRPAAVKLLDVDRMSDSAITRFEREVQLTSALTHPNTVAVFDYGRTPEGIFYYAMEYLEGMNLDDFVRRYGKLPEARAVFLLKQICGSLAEAHAAGLVHRDVKPANILLTRRGGLSDYVKVLDFGLAKEHGQDRANLTNPNALMGTPLYISPEAINQPDTVDARSDVYAVGAVAYFLLTGSPVFSGATVVEICMKHVKDKPVRPSVRINEPITIELEDLVLRCLSKSPADRFKSAEELLQELETCPAQGTWDFKCASAWWASHLVDEQTNDSRFAQTRIVTTRV